jgi:hypothetical protein
MGAFVGYVFAMYGDLAFGERVNDPLIAAQSSTWGAEATAASGVGGPPDHQRQAMVRAALRGAELNAPNWLWFLIAILVILAVLYLVGIRVNVG